MTLPQPENMEAWIGLALFVASEALALSKAKDNSVIQLALHMASELFPYELHRREPPKPTNRPARRRSSSGKFLSGDSDANRS